MNSPYEVESALSTMEQAHLAAYEDTIRQGLRTFYAVGSALSAIRDSRLYRERFPTFEAYCQERWGIVASRARQLIAASAVVETLRSVTDVTLLPTTEAQCRPLVNLPPEDQGPTWREAVKQAAPSAPSAIVVKREVVRHRAVTLTPGQAVWTEEDRPLLLRLLAAKQRILSAALALLADELDHVTPSMLTSIPEDAAESAGYEVLESPLMAKLARAMVRS